MSAAQQQGAQRVLHAADRRRVVSPGGVAGPPGTLSRRPESHRCIRARPPLPTRRGNRGAVAAAEAVAGRGVRPSAVARSVVACAAVAARLPAKYGPPPGYGYPVQ